MQNQWCDMDEKTLELYEEEKRKALIDLNDNVVKLATAIQELKDAYKQPPEEIAITNPVSEIDVTNLSDIETWLGNLSTSFKEIIEANTEELPDTFIISNIKDAKATSVKVSNLKDLSKLFEKLGETIKQNTPIINVETNEVVFPRLPKDAIPVRLTDGKEFYKAVMQAVSGGAGETDPLVGYQPSDIDEATSTKYYGFVKSNSAWYIMREASGAYRYAVGKPVGGHGTNNYADAWIDRANLTYNYFFEVF